ncbi:hypothetical protein Mgra_00001264 [Meloidogyne graminicola]|uniref:Uncharacterized protein n=1 Tax=Meloidogyne graminicola TaxID=189291 RepID=A0A8T0A000_9BILA|nr:hypothetical protein Mgra_00001264 [Meloidogyne graminicola]
MDDDAFGFGELAYDDDDLAYQEDNQNVEDKSLEEKTPSKDKKKHKRKAPRINKTQDTSLKVVENRRDSDIDFCNVFNSGKRESIFTSESPLDWHLNVGEDEMRKKRRKLEIDGVMDRIAQRILKARQENSQKSKIEEKVNPQPKNEVSSTSTLLPLPPMDGNAWYGINSPDGITRRYVRIEPKKNVKKQVSTSNEDKIKEIDDYFSLFNRMEEQKRQRLLYSLKDEKMEISDPLQLD